MRQPDPVQIADDAPAASWPHPALTRILPWLEHAMEFGLYLYVYALFRSNTLRVALIFIMLAALLLHVALTRGERLRGLRHPVLVLTGLFVGLVFLSVLRSPHVALALGEFGQTLALVALLAVVVPYALRDERALRRLLYVAGFTAIYLNVIQLKGILIEHNATGAWLQDVDIHRPHSLSIIFYLPFILALANLEKGWWAGAWWSVAGLQGLMLAATAGRAAILSISIAFLLWLWFRWNKKTLVFAATTIGFVLAFILLVPKQSFVYQWFTKGASASDRIELTWGPGAALIAAKPLIGYGFGSTVYPEAFEARIPKAAIPSSGTDAGWEWTKQLGPHNYFLEIWFYAGALAVAAMVWLYARFFGQLFVLAGGSRTPLLGLTALATLVAFTAMYLVHAHFGPSGTSGWRPLGVLLGLGLALALINDEQRKRNPVKAPS